MKGISGLEECSIKHVGPGIMIDVGTFYKNRELKKNVGRNSKTGKIATVYTVSEDGTVSEICTATGNTFREMYGRMQRETKKNGVVIPTSVKVRTYGKTFISLAKKEAKKIKIVVSKLNGPERYGVKADVFKILEEGQEAFVDDFTCGTFEGLCSVLSHSDKISLPVGAHIKETGVSILHC